MLYIIESRDIYSGHFTRPPPRRGGKFLSKNLKEDLKKGKEKKKKKEKSGKTHVKIPLLSLNTAKKIHKNREEF